MPHGIRAPDLDSTTRYFRRHLLKPPEAVSSVKALFSRIEVGIDIIFVLTVPMCVTGVTLTVPIASGIKLFKKGQIVRPLV